MNAGALPSNADQRGELVSLSLDEVPEGFLSFYCPLPEQVGRDKELLMTETLAWSQRFDLGAGDDAATYKYGVAGTYTVAHLFPHATGELAQVLSDYSAWAFTVNDFVVPEHPGSVRMCDVVHAVCRLVRIFRSPDSWPAEQMSMRERALQDTLWRLRPRVTDVQYDRFVSGMFRWLHDMLWETALRERGERLNCNDYLAMRLGTSGMYATLAYLDAVEGTEITAREHADPLFRATIEAGLYTATLDNDRYSYFKESGPALKKCNLFDALMLEHPGWSEQQAMTEGVAIRDAMAHLYMRLRDQILPAASEDLRRFLAGVDRVVSGNVTFGTTCVRYFNPDVLPTVQRTATPCQHMPEGPLPYPTISWWWEQLK